MLDTWNASSKFRLHSGNLYLKRMIQGFRHFDTFMRGREELVLRVYPITQSPTCSTLLPSEIDR